MGSNPKLIDGSQFNLYPSATLTYADTNEHELISTPEEMEYYKDLIVEFKVTTLAGTTGETLTLGIATSNYELTGANAFAELTSDYWTTKAITLNAGADVFYYRIRIPANEINGKYIYAKYQYDADPTGDPTIEAKYNLI